MPVPGSVNRLGIRTSTWLGRLGPELRLWVRVALPGDRAARREPPRWLGGQYRRFRRLQRLSAHRFVDKPWTEMIVLVVDSNGAVGVAGAEPGPSSVTGPAVPSAP